MARVTSAISCFRSFSASSSFGACAFISISPFAAPLRRRGLARSIQGQSEQSLKTLRREPFSQRIILGGMEQRSSDHLYGPVRNTHRFPRDHLRRHARQLAKRRQPTPLANQPVSASLNSCRYACCGNAWKTSSVFLPVSRRNSARCQVTFAACTACRRTTARCVAIEEVLK
jgi:hypothetical protein